MASKQDALQINKNFGKVIFWLRLTKDADGNDISEDFI